jgi:hypothetical protein
VGVVKQPRERSSTRNPTRHDSTFSPLGGDWRTQRQAAMKKWRIVRSGFLARRDRKGSLNDGQMQNPSNPFGIVPLSNFVPRGFGFVHH